MWVFFALLMLLNVAFVLWLLWYYKAPTAPVSSLLVTFYAWSISLSIIALVPMDVAGTKLDDTVHAIGIMWLISYWSTQVLTWLLIPLFMVYVDAGDFTTLGKIQTSLKENLVFYGAMLGLGIIGIIIILATSKMSIGTMFANFPSLAATLSNTFGLFMCILLLSYGVVEIPKLLWQKADPKHMIRLAHHKVGRLADQLEDASFEIERSMKAVELTRSQIRTRDELHPYITLICDYAHKNSPIVPGSLSVDMDTVSPEDLQFGDDLDSLAVLMRRVRRSIYTYKSAYQSYKDTVQYAFRLEHMIKCIQTHIYVPPEGSPATRSAAFHWRYVCIVHPWVLRLLALVCAILGILIVWCEITIGFTETKLSPFSALLDTTSGEIGITLVVLIPLVYICICSYFSLFRLAMFDFYRLVPGYTNPYCMLLNATLLCRFAAPLAFNVLHVLRMNKDKTVFSEKMGSITEDSILGTNFNTWFPLATIIVCLLMLLNAWNQILGRFIPSRFRFSMDDAEDDYTSRGKTIVDRERTARNRGLVIGQVLGFVGGVDAERGARGKGGSVSVGELTVLDVDRHQGYSHNHTNSSSSGGWQQLPPAGTYKPPGQVPQARAQSTGDSSGGRWSQLVQNTQNMGSNFLGRFRKGDQQQSQQQPNSRPSIRQPRSQPRAGTSNLDDIFSGLEVRRDNNNPRIDDTYKYMPRKNYSSY